MTDPLPANRQAFLEIASSLVSNPALDDEEVHAALCGLLQAMAALSGTKRGSKNQVPRSAHLAQ
jgi:hypothetical protein